MHLLRLYERAVWRGCVSMGADWLLVAVCPGRFRDAHARVRARWLASAALSFGACACTRAACWLGMRLIGRVRGARRYFLTGIGQQRRLYPTMHTQVRKTQRGRCLVCPKGTATPRIRFACGFCKQYLCPGECFETFHSSGWLQDGSAAAGGAAGAARAVGGAAAPAAAAAAAAAGGAGGAAAGAARGAGARAASAAPAAGGAAAPAASAAPAAGGAASGAASGAARGAGARGAGAAAPAAAGRDSAAAGGTHGGGAAAL